MNETAKEELENLEEYYLSEVRRLFNEEIHNIIFKGEENEIEGAEEKFRDLEKKIEVLNKNISIILKNLVG